MSQAPETKSPFGARPTGSSLSTSTVALCDMCYRCMCQSYSNIFRYSMISRLHKQCMSPLCGPTDQGRQQYIRNMVVACRGDIPEEQWT